MEVQDLIYVIPVPDPFTQNVGAGAADPAWQLPVEYANPGEWKKPDYWPGLNIGLFTAW